MNQHAADQVALILGVIVVICIGGLLLEVIRLLWERRK